MNTAAGNDKQSPCTPDISAFPGNGRAATDDPSPLHGIRHSDAREAPQQSVSGHEDVGSLHAAMQPHRPPSTPYTTGWPPCLVLVFSCLSVAAAGLGGNAVRLAMERCFAKYPFFAKFNYIEPNTIGSFVMGLAVTILPPEPHLPLTYRAICVGFCGSLTTFSTWMVEVMVQDTAGNAFEHLFLGATMPIVFFIWGRDFGRSLRWCYAELLHCPWESWTTHRGVLRTLDLAVFALLVVAAVLTPLLVQVYINRRRVRVISTDDIHLVALAPIGAVLRFLLAFCLNKRDCVAQFPTGTFIANSAAVILAVVMFNMQILHPWNAWFAVVQQGISGSLSTVSSLVNEVVGFYGEGRSAFTYLYCVVTVGVSIFIGGVGRPQMYRRTVS